MPSDSSRHRTSPEVLKFWPCGLPPNFRGEPPMPSDSSRHRTSPAVLKFWPCGLPPNFQERAARAACAAPSDDENMPRARRYFQESQRMLYFVQQKPGDKPYLRRNVVERATIWAMCLGLKPIVPKLLYKIQLSPSSGPKYKENVAFFAGFAAHMPGEGAC